MATFTLNIPFINKKRGIIVKEPKTTETIFPESSQL